MNPLYAEAVERQSEWLRFSESAVGQRMWDEMREESANPYERIVHETPLRSGEVFYVDDDFCRLIEAAQFTLPDATFRPEMVPVPCGWVWLERPLALPMTAEQAAVAQAEADKVMGRPTRIVNALHIDALGWTAHLEDPSAYHFTAYARHRAEEGDLISTDADGRARKIVKLPDYVFMPVANWRMAGGDSLAQRVEEFESAARAGSRYVRSDVHEMRYAVAMLLLMEQRILSTRREPLDRARRRRIERNSGLVRDHLMVVTLRRYQERGPAAEHAAEVEWSCRWIVRGFWRQQWFPKSREHRPIWIMPFVKGPPDKPLKGGGDRRRIFAATR